MAKLLQFNHYNTSNCYAQVCAKAHKSKRRGPGACSHPPPPLIRIRCSEIAPEAILRQTESNEGGYNWLVREEECLGVEDKYIHLLCILIILKHW